MKRLSCLAAMAVAAVLVCAPAALAQSGDLDCSAFATQEAPQAILDAHPNGLDMYGLDADGDGAACEGLGGGAPEDGSAAATQQQTTTGAATTTTPLPSTGGPSLTIPAAAAPLLLGSAGLLGSSSSSRGTRGARGTMGNLGRRRGGKKW